MRCRSVDTGPRGKALALCEKRVRDTILIAGPTASGKSRAALAVAKRLGGTIVNADSMQVYRDLHILTARPLLADSEAVPHRLYGTISAQEAYSVARWARDAQLAIEEARNEGRVPIITGGTGLYFKVLLEGLSPVPDIPAEIRDAWRHRAATSSPEALHQELSARDPVMAKRLPPTDAQRLVRALEVIDATAISLADWQEVSGNPVLDDQAVVKLLVAPEREALYAAIDKRFDTMLKAGALQEVERLAARGLDEGLPAMRALGVRELRAYLGGTMSLEDAVTKAKTETRRYAKRQMTWAKRFMADWHQFSDADTVAVSEYI